MKRHRWLAAAVVVGLMTTAACGQKKGVHVATAGPGGGALGTGGDAFGVPAAATDDGTTATTDGAAAAPTGATAATPGATTPAASGASGAPATAPKPGGATSATTVAKAGTATTAAAGGGPAAAAKGPADRTGVSDTEIRVGVHGPATGAGAPAPSFDMGKDVYYKSVGNIINGRSVKVFFADDGYNPSQAVAGCKKLVEQDKVFLLVGAGGTDQIVACAQYAASVNVPYLAEGVTEKGLGNLPNYFAQSMTYKAQADLLGQYIAKVVGKKDVVMVRGDTANFDDAHAGFIAAAQKYGLTVKKDITTNKDGNTAATSAGDVCAAIGGPTGAANAVVYPLMSPKAFITFATAAAQQQCFPRYAGVGLTLGLNVVAQALCPSGAYRNGATFFSPFQGLDVADPEFKKAYQAQNGKAGDDIGYGLWGASKLLSAELTAGGRELSRQSFVTGLQGKSFTSGVFPTADFTKSRFGGTGVHVLKADCTKSPPEYITEFQHKTGF